MSGEKSIKRRLVTLVDLTDARRKETRAVAATSRTDAIRWLREGYAITASGDNGALNVWKDKNGLWRCEFMRFLICQDSRSYKHIAAVDAWLAETFPKLTPKAKP